MSPEIPAAADLSAMPHLLIAGATGSGKSVSVNAIICGLLLNNTPDDLTPPDGRSQEGGIDRLQRHPPSAGTGRGRFGARGRRPAVGSPRDGPALPEAGQRMALAILSTINEQVGRQGESKLPYLVVIIDELADLDDAGPG